MAFDYSPLIIDRAASDSDALRALVKKPMSQWTAAEAETFTAATLKGSYDYTDLNRVSACMEDLVARLNGLGYQVPGYERVKIERTVKPSSRLPDGYTEVQYIQSSGTQYVDSLFTPNQDTRIVYDCERFTAAANERFFGVRTGSSAVAAFSVYTYQSGWRNAYNNSVVGDGAASTGRYIIDMNKNVVTINQTVTLTNTYGTFTAAASALLFARRDAPDGIAYGSHKLFSCQIYDNGTLIRDFVPCKNADNAVGLYDLVNNQFYGNAGTGSFTAGDVVESASESDTEELDPYLWYATDIPTQVQMRKYIGNVLALRNEIDQILNYYSAESQYAFPDTPVNMSQLTYQEANNVEQILESIELQLTYMSNHFYWYYSGEVYAREI